MEPQNGARPRTASRGSKGKAPAPPPPPPSRDDEPNGGHRRGQVRRRHHHLRVRGDVLAVILMIAAAAYILFADALAVPAAAAPVPGCYFAAFVLWIVGVTLLFRFMRN